MTTIPQSIAAGVERYDTLEKLQEGLSGGGLRELWQALRSHQGEWSPNADPDYFLAVCQVMGARPQVVKIAASDGSHALLVARRMRRHLRTHLGYWQLPCPSLEVLEIVYGGVLLEAETLAARQVAPEIRELLRQGDHLFLNHLPLNHPLYPQLHKMAHVQRSAEKHWQYRLIPGGWTQMLAAFSGKHRHNIHQKERIFQKRGAVSVRCYEKLEEVEVWLEAACGISQRTYQAGMGVGLDRGLWSKLLASESALGRMRCYLLWCDDRPVAFQLGLLYGTTFFLQAMGYDPEYHKESAGSVLLIRVLEDLCQSGQIDLVDYGFGDATYKQTYGTQEQLEATLLIYRHSLRGLWAHAMERVATDGQRLFSRLGGKFLPLIKRLWRRSLVPPKPGTTS